MPADLHPIDAAPNTRRAYTADWRDFTAWCAQHDRCALPALPATVADYLADRAEQAADRAPLAVATLDRRVATISQAHQLAGYATPTKSEAVRSKLKGIRRARRTGGQRQARPATTPILKQLLAAARPGLAGQRDRALLLIGFAGAFRRSELVALDCADLDFRTDGLVIMVRRSKTDQEGQGREIAIPYGSTPATCPVRALQAWLVGADIVRGPIFRAVHRAGRVARRRLEGRSVARIVQACAQRAGLDPHQFSGHSLRAGLATAAAEAGFSSHAIKRQTGHKSDRVLDRYIRGGTLFKGNVAAGLGL